MSKVELLKDIQDKLMKFQVKVDSDAFGREFNMGEMSVEQQPGSDRKIGENKSVPGQEDATKPTSEGGSPKKVNEISGKMDKDAFGKEFDLGEVSVDQHSDDESSTKIGEDKSVVVGEGKDLRNPAFEGTPRKVELIPGRMNKDAFGEEFVLGDMSVDPQPGDSFKKIGESKSTTVPGKEDAKKPESEGSPRKLEDIPSHVDKVAFGREFNVGEMSVDLQPGDESLTKNLKDRPVAIPAEEQDARRPTSEGSPREVDEIPFKMDVDAFGKKLDIGDMNINQQPDNGNFVKIYEDESVTVLGKDVNKSAPETLDSLQKLNEADGSMLDSGTDLIFKQDVQFSAVDSFHSTPHDVLPGSGKEEAISKQVVNNFAIYTLFNTNIN